MKIASQHQNTRAYLREGWYSTLSDLQRKVDFSLSSCLSKPTNGLASVEFSCAFSKFTNKILM